MRLPSISENTERADFRFTGVIFIGSILLKKDLNSHKKKDHLFVIFLYICLHIEKHFYYIKKR